jgi:hypothetical protein
MPVGAKLVIAFQGFFLLLTLAVVVAGFTHHAAVSIQVARLVILAFQIALFSGLYARQRIAWYVGRWLAGILTFGYAITLVGTVVYVLASAPAVGTYVWKTEQFYTSWHIAITLILAITFFRLLGRPDSRAYLNGPRRPNQTMQPTASPRTASVSDD